MPSQMELMWPTLLALRTLGSDGRTSRIDHWVARKLDLAEEVLKLRTKNDRVVFENRTGFARTRLKYIGAVVNLHKGKWALTERGGWIRSAHKLKDLETQAAKIRKGMLSVDELEGLWRGMGPKDEEENPGEDDEDLTPLTPRVMGPAENEKNLDKAADEIMQAVEQTLRVYGGATTEERRAVEKAAMEAVMEAERDLGHCPEDVSDERGIGYDIESRENDTARLRFIEVKGRAEGANTVTVTRNEISAAVENRDAFILVIVEVANGKAGEPRYVREPFRRKPDAWAISATYKLSELLARAKAPS